MIMRGLAWGLTRVVGPLVLPGLVVGIAWSVHSLVKERDERMRIQGERRCDARWEAEVRAEERRQAAAQIAEAQRRLDVERQVTEGLRNERQTLDAEMAELRGKLSSDRSCLSDGVLDALDRAAGRKAGAGPGAKQKRVAPGS